MMGKAQKLLLCAVLVLLLLAAVYPAMTASAEGASPCVAHGDMNGDGVIDRQDAIYNLYSILLGTNLYPANQDRDINGDGQLDRQDAIYLLYASIGIFQQQYPLKGQLHSYNATWHWNDETHSVEASLQCTCGEKSHSQSLQALLTENIPANCTHEGAATYTASLTYEGIVYENSKTYVLAVNGEHQYENGVCIHCQQPEGPVCRHAVTTQTLVEGLCPDTKLYHVTCQCGENAYYVLENMGCTLDEGSLHTSLHTDALGMEYSVLEGVCTQCGLISRLHGSHYTMAADGCRMWRTEQTELVLTDGTTATLAKQSLVQNHFPTKDVTTVTLDMDSHGICGQTLLQGSCSCGRHQSFYVSRSLCQWEMLDALDGNLRQQCSVCHTIREVTLRQEALGNCRYTLTQTETYLKDGQVLFTATRTDESLEHGQNVSQHTELLGSQCTDGLLLIFSCGDCGHREETLVTEHLLLEETDIPVSDSCISLLKVTACPCGAHKQIEPVDSAACSWQETQPGCFVCTTCGLMRNEVREIGEKDAACRYEIFTTVSYLDPQGKVLASGSQTQEAYAHQMHPQTTLLGSTCTDGLLTQEICSDCGHTESTVLSYDHDEKLHSSVDLTGGQCCSHVLQNTYGCTCHAKDRIEIFWEQENCNFAPAGHSEAYGAQIYRCTACPLECISIWQERSTEEGTVQVIVNMYFLEGQEIFRFETIV